MHVSNYRRRRRSRSKRVKRGWRPSDNFIADVEAKLDSTNVHSLFELSQLSSASAHSTTLETDEDSQLKPWQNADVKDLIRQRHNCSDQLTRRNLSKAIFKATRKHTREYCTSQTERILRSFKDLSRLDDLHRLPSRSTSDPQCTSEDFANLLSDIYSCNDVAEQPCIESLRQLPRFTNREFQIALKSMKLNKCSD